jgi:hypothetical protein
MDNKLQKIEDDIVGLNIDLKTIPEFAEALYFVHKLEKYAKNLKDKIKIQGSQLMCDNEDIQKLEFDKFTIIKTSSSESLDFDPKSLIETLSIEQAAPFLSVNNTKFKPYLESLIRYGAINAEQSAYLNKTAKLKRRKGSLQIREKTETQMITR